MRTDKHRNPTAFTTDVAITAGLKVTVDYNVGDSFQVGAKTYFTAFIVGDPVEVTIKLIDVVGFTTKFGNPRWSYINVPKFVWSKLDNETKRDVIGLMYQHEGGISMRELFPNYGKLL